MTEPDSWEELEQLTLQPPVHKSPSTSPTGEPNRLEDTPSTNEVGTEVATNEPEKEPIDQALKEALKNPRERPNVLRIEADVAKFVTDKTRCTIEFPPELTSYQRLLAHRVSQLYGLQTSSVPLGSGLSRVIAHKTQETKLPPVRVFDVKDVYKPPEAEKASSPPDVIIKRRQITGMGHLAPGSENDKNGDGSAGGIMTVKQREEEYKAARERILGTEVEQKTGDTTEDPAVEESEEDIKNRKAVFRNKAKEQQDPDYKRGSNRFQPPLAYDPKAPYGDGKTGNSGVYNVPTYNSEFPALPGAVFRPPPPTTGHFPSPVTTNDHHRPFPLPGGQLNYGATLLNRPPTIPQGPRVPNRYPLPFPGTVGASPTGAFPYAPIPLPFRLPPNRAQIPVANSRPMVTVSMPHPAGVWTNRPRPGNLPSSTTTTAPLLPNPRMYGYPPFQGYPPGYPAAAGAQGTAGPGAPISVVRPPPPPPQYFPPAPTSQVPDVGNPITEGEGNGSQQVRTIRRKTVPSTAADCNQN